MRKEYRERLVTALRSGEFEQGHGALNKDGKFCCMGVFCEVEGLPKTERETNGSKYILYGYKGKETIHLPPASLRSKARLTDDNLIKLIHLNDSNKKSFEEIADWIEEHL